MRSVQMKLLVELAELIFSSPSGHSRGKAECTDLRNLEAYVLLE